MRPYVAVVGDVVAGDPNGEPGGFEYDGDIVLFASVEELKQHVVERRQAPEQVYAGLRYQGDVRIGGER